MTKQEMLDILDSKDLRYSILKPIINHNDVNIEIFYKLINHKKIKLIVNYEKIVLWDIARHKNVTIDILNKIYLLDSKIKPKTLSINTWGY